MLLPCSLCYSCLCCIAGVIYKYTKIWDFGSTLKSRPSQNELTAWGAGEGVPSQHQQWKRMFDPSIIGMEWDQDGPLSSGTINVIAAQLCCVMAII
jgi:hypothetical protein